MGAPLSTIPGLQVDPRAPATIVVLGASWCVPCVEVARTPADALRAHPGVDGVVVAVDDEPGALAAAAGAEDLFRTVPADPAFLEERSLDTFPLTLVADGEGTIRATWGGAVGREDLETVLAAAGSG